MIESKFVQMKDLVGLQEDRWCLLIIKTPSFQEAFTLTLGLGKFWYLTAFQVSNMAREALVQ